MPGLFVQESFHPRVFLSKSFCQSYNIVLNEVVTRYTLLNSDLIKTCHLIISHERNGNIRLVVKHQLGVIDNLV